MTLLEDLAQYIINAGHATALGTDIFYDSCPDTPNNLIALYEYDSAPMLDSSAVRYVQVTARNELPSEAKSNCASLFQLFMRDNDNITTLPNNRWAIFTPRQSPLKISEDDLGRVTFGFNVIVVTELT